jgi:hypothetical protein
MKLEQKAYKCIVNFDNYFDTPIDESHWNDKEVYQIIYGQGIHGAVKEYCETDEFYTYSELLKVTRARRFKEADLYSQEPSELLKGLTGPQIHNLTHSLGVDTGDRCPVEFHHNYSLYYEKHEGCQYLVTIGLMTNWQKTGSECYAVTEAGKEAVKTLLLVTK